jgi:hypothetical protein
MAQISGHPFNLNECSTEDEYFDVENWLCDDLKAWQSMNNNKTNPICLLFDYRGHTKKLCGRPAEQVFPNDMGNFSSNKCHRHRFTQEHYQYLLDKDAEYVAEQLARQVATVNISHVQ